MSKFSVKYLAHWTCTSFRFAAEHIDDHVEPAFSDAAGGDSDDGYVKPMTQGTFKSDLMSRATLHSMVDGEANHKGVRAQERSFTKETLQSVHIH